MDPWCFNWFKNRPFFWRNKLIFRAKRRHLLGTASDRTSRVCQRTRLGPSFICTEHHRAFIDSLIHRFIDSFPLSLSLYLSPFWPFDHSAAFVVGTLAAMPSSCPFPSGFWFRGTSFFIRNMCLNAGAKSLGEAPWGGLRCALGTCRTSSMRRETSPLHWLGRPCAALWSAHLDSVKGLAWVAWCSSASSFQYNLYARLISFGYPAKFWTLAVAAWNWFDARIFTMHLHSLCQGTAHGVFSQVTEQSATVCKLCAKVGELCECFQWKGEARPWDC